MDFLSKWDWLDLVGLLFVFCGVFGTVVLLFVKVKKFSYNENDLMPKEYWQSKWQTRRDALEKRKHHWEIVFEIILVIGLALELWAMPHHNCVLSVVNARSPE